MKTTLKIIGCIIVSIFLTIGCFAAKIFVIGSVIPVDEAYLSKINVTDSQISIGGDIMGSATAFRGCTYKVEGQSFYIKVYDVFVSGLFRYSDIVINIKGNFKNIKNIYLEDKKGKTLVWNETNR